MLDDRLPRLAAQIAREVVEPLGVMLDEIAREHPASGAVVLLEHGFHQPFEERDIAVDPDSNIVAVADENKFSLRTYDRGLATADVADPRTVVTGVKSGIDFVCGVAIDSVHKQIYTANNDTAADLMVFNYVP